MTLFDELVFEKKWDTKVWILFAFASFTLVIELASLGVHVYKKILLEAYPSEEEIVK